jgi:hypothetical protein
LRGAAEIVAAHRDDPKVGTTTLGFVPVVEGGFTFFEHLKPERTASLSAC